MDWTNKSKPNPTNKDNEFNTPSKYQYVLDSADKLSELHVVKDFPIEGEVKTDLDVPVSGLANPEYYYVTDQNQVIFRTSGDQIFKYFIPYQTNTGNSTYDFKLSPLFMTRGKKFFSYTYSIYVPEIGIRGRHAFSQDGEDTESTIAAGRLVFFRGIQPTKGGKSFPMASNHNYNFNGERIGEYSLLLNGVDGIMNKFGREVVNFMENRSTLQIILYLNIRDIINFRPEYKIRIQNMNYFVSSLKIRFTNKGIKPVTATLESII